MIEPTPQELEEQYDPFEAYEDYEIDTLVKILQLVKNYRYCIFNMHQAERLMLDVYYATLNKPKLGYTFTDPDEQYYISPEWSEFETNFNKLVARHEYHSNLERQNEQRKLLNMKQLKPKYPLQLHYTL